VDANLTVQDLFKLILFLVGIGVGTYFILVLSKINKILGQAKGIIDANMKELDTTIKQLPEISQNVNDITRETKEVLTELGPEVGDLVHNINSISEQASSITNTVKDTTEKVGSRVEDVAESIADTALAFQYGTKSLADYINIIMEIFEALKNMLNKR
jgi:methyl-accepting chemotaxis protein